MPDRERVEEAVNDGALAHAAEHGIDQASDGHTHERNCLNCGTALVGPCCHVCGQKANVPRTIAAWWHDVLHSVLHIDGKFWTTVWLLVSRPGELTRRYAHGERTKFVSPLALFLFTVLLMFAAFSLLGGPVQFSGGSDGTVATADIQEQRTEALAEVRRLEQELESLRAADQPTQATERQLLFARFVLATIQDATTSGPGGEAAAVGQQEIASGTTRGGARGTLTVNPTGIAAIDRSFAKARENPELLLYKLQANAYKFSWMLIPISVPFVWLLFVHRRRYRHDFTGYDHLVFTTYSIAFMTLWAIALGLLRALGIDETAIAAALILVPPAHIYRQLRGAYGLSRGSALWRTAALLFFAVIALMLFVSFLMTIGFLD
jgi:hypothetical protein